MRIWLGPVGELQEIECFPGVPVTPSRTGESFVALSGKKTDFVGSRVHRTWVFNYVWSDPLVVDWLAQLASGGVVGPHYLYTSKAAKENLAPPVLQSGGTGVFNGRRVFATDDLVYYEHKIPVKPSTLYGISFLGELVGNVEIKTYTAAGVVLTTSSVVGTAGGRKYVSVMPGPTAAYMTLTPSRTLGQFRVTEGPHEGFRTGDGVPQVIVRDPDQTLQRVMDGDVRVDYTFSIEETG